MSKRFRCAVGVLVAGIALSPAAGFAAALTPGDLVFPNQGLNALEEFNPSTRSVVQTIPLPAGYGYSNLELSAVISPITGDILTNVRDASGRPTVLALGPDGIPRGSVAVNSLSSDFLQQIVIDPLDPTGPNVLGGVPFTGQIISANPYTQAVSSRVSASGSNFIGLTTGTAGVIYAGDFANGVIDQYAANGDAIGVFANVGAVTGDSEINGMTRDLSGNVLVAQNGANQVVEFNAAGQLVATLKGATFDHPISPFADPNDGLIYIGNGNDVLTVLTASGTEAYHVSLGGAVIGVPALVSVPEPGCLMMVPVAVLAAIPRRR